MKNIVIIGGGFAGAYIAKKLEKNKDFNVILIDSKNYYEFTPGILRTLVSPKHAKKIQVLHTHYLKKAKVVVDCVKKMTEKEIITANKHKLKFDYLFICSGSSYNAPFKEKNIVNLTRTRHIRDYYHKLDVAKKIIIIGGGIVGTELAGEIIDFYKGKNEKEIIVIHKHDKLMERNHEKTIDYADKFLKKHNVNILYNETALNYENNLVKTDKNRKIKADLVFLCTGITPNSEFIPKKLLNSEKQVNINEYFQVLDNKSNKPLKNIFAAGDITSIKEEKLAQNAEKHAKLIVKNINLIENNKEPKSYSPEKRIIVISLGRFNGIFQYKNKFIITGLLPGLLKTLIEWKTMRRYKL
ncbi:FAD-dependent oxidoreductase [Candidatus Pacearchaeota archaeon]|nr:FAD-dependent oxidoreductase [Candidatus Pacearchaeota archaeon]